MRTALRMAAFLGLCLASPLAVAAQDRSLGLAGSYLAARHASFEGNYGTAAEFYLRALQADPENLDLRENAVLSLAALGDWDQAVAIAATLPRTEVGRELAELVEQVDRLRRGDSAAAIQAIEEGRAAGPLIDDLSLGWLRLDLGDMSSAVAAFESIANGDGPLAGIAQYQLALARATVGDFEGAEQILSGDAFGPIQVSPRGIRAHAQVLVQLDRQPDALQLLDMALSGVADPALIALREAIVEDPTRPYDFAVTAKEGLAEVFFAMSRALGLETGSALPLIYARAAYGIDPTHVDAILLSAELLAEERQFQLAADTFALVPVGDIQFVTAELGRADALFELGHEEASVEVMQALARAHPDLATVQAGLGDTLRRLERYGEAIRPYTRALDLVDQSQQRYWFVFYARGISHEREGMLDEAEADFRRALELEPGQPQVLNYLGYSLVEQRRNLDEALDMIERAVAARPDSGYIVDSLGWVFYRLGRFEEAVEPMERAVELLPNDPIINDHLGDVYWKVGRTREAEFQWHRALSFEPEPADAVRIRRKLEVGLDVVLREEAEGGGNQ